MKTNTETMENMEEKTASERLMALEEQYGAHN